jgi:hypothetical protein
MVATRILLVIPALMLFVLPITADAQGRGNAGRNGNGPAFCRNGQGHPVHGWEWCEQRGWGSRSSTARGARERVAVPRDRDTGATVRGRRVENRRVNDAAFENGYDDGYEKGLDDGNDRREFDPTRHNWYRSADRNYDSSYGSRAAYANVYRDGFRSGYEAGYADGERYGTANSTGSRFPWPF